MGDILDDLFTVTVVGTGPPPPRPDSDGDGLYDDEEGGDPASADYSDPHAGDTDGDGVGDAEERALGSYTNSVDSDRDGLTDGDEVHVYGTDPAHWDTDRDGLRDRSERDYGGDARNPDTDGDGVLDGEEVRRRTGVDDVDTDGDGLRDGLEINQLHSNPNSIDTDHDGIDDATEYHSGGDPTEHDYLDGVLLEQPASSSEAVAFVDPDALDIETAAIADARPDQALGIGSRLDASTSAHLPDDGQHDGDAAAFDPVVLDDPVSDQGYASGLPGDEAGVIGFGEAPVVDAAAGTPPDIDLTASDAALGDPAFADPAADVAVVPVDDGTAPHEAVDEDPAAVEVFALDDVGAFDDFTV
jgi:hypothetical protein